MTGLQFLQERFYFTPANLAMNFSLEEAVAQFEQSLIEEALRKSAGNKAQAAELFGVPVSTLKSKLKKYVAIDVDETSEGDKTQTRSSHQL